VMEDATVQRTAMLPSTDRALPPTAEHATMDISASDDEVRVVQPASEPKSWSSSARANGKEAPLVLTGTTGSGKRPRSLTATAGPENDSFPSFIHDEIGITRAVVLSDVPVSCSFKEKGWTHDPSRARARTLKAPLRALVDPYVLD